MYNWNKNLRIIFVVLSVLFSHISLAQSSVQKTEIDSLENKLKSMPDDSIKVKAMLKLSDYYKNENSVRQIQLCESAVALAGKINYLKGKSNALNNLGLIYKDQSNYAKALELNPKSPEAHIGRALVHDFLGDRRSALGRPTHVSDGDPRYSIPAPPGPRKTIRPMSRASGC